MRKLYFSNGSPYARKVRIVLAEKGLDYEKDVYDLVRPIEEIGDLNPCLAVPVLIDGAVHLFESNLIVEYLLTTYPGVPADTPEPPLAASMTRLAHHWDDAKTLAVIEAMADSIVNLRMMQGSGAAADQIGYLGRQQSRIQHCLDWLEQRATPEGFIPGVFSIQDINLLCPLSFAEKRGVIQWRGRPRLESIVERWRHRPSVAATPVNNWPPPG